MTAIVSDCEANAEAAVNIFLIGMDGLNYGMGRIVRRMSLEIAGVTVNILVTVL